MQSMRIEPISNTCRQSVLNRIAGYCLALTLAIVAQDTAESSATTLHDYVAHAMRANPAIAALRSKVASAGYAVKLSTALPEPSLSAGYFISEVETRVGPQRAKLGASQNIPWPGKLQAQRGVAEANAAATHQELETARTELAAAIADVYAALYATGRAISISHDNLKLLRYMERVLRTRYAAASVAQTSVLKVQVEAAVLDDNISSLGSRAATQRERLKALLGGEFTRPIDFPHELPDLAPDPAQDALIDSLKLLNPALQRAAFLTLHAERNVTLAKAALAPDFMLMTDYIITEETSSSMVTPGENGKDPWIIGLSFTLPLRITTNASEISQARALRAQAAAGEKDLRNTLSARAVEFYRHYHDTQRKIALYESVLVPKARQTLSLLQEAYANSQATLLDFLDAQRRLLDLEIEYARLQAQLLQTTGRLDMLTGGAKLLSKADYSTPVSRETDL
ncbi:MAG: hypothetical protein GF398_20270 [Chitinivibrionales bacterium]|nr:hypothetical protein [Chitinivibrionales bacterium]